METGDLRPDDDALREFLRTARPRLAAILRRYQVEETQAVQILSDAWVRVAWSETSFEERFRRLIDAMEGACRELRAERGPVEEEEDEPYVH